MSKIKEKMGAGDIKIISKPKPTVKTLNKVKNIKVVIEKVD